jgi:hypothetical protein
VSDFEVIEFTLCPVKFWKPGQRVRMIKLADDSDPDMEKYLGCEGSIMALADDELLVLLDNADAFYFTPEELQRLI